MYQPIKSDFRNKYKNKRKIKISFNQLLNKQSSLGQDARKVKGKNQQTKNLIGRLSKLMDIEKKIPKKSDFE